MKKLIKQLLRENLGNTEVGNREDARWASKMPTYPPFVNLMVQVDTDFGRDSELYRALLEYFVSGGKDLKGILHILKAFDVEDRYMHFLNVNEVLSEANNGMITVYHGTNPKFVDNIKKQGLTSNLGYDNASWYMVSTDLPSALFHATASEDTSIPVYVFEFQVPITNQKWEGYPYFWPPYDRSGQSKWFSLKQPLPAKFIKKVHEIPYSKWIAIKGSKNF